MREKPNNININDPKKVKFKKSTSDVCPHLILFSNQWSSTAERPISITDLLRFDDMISVIDGNHDQSLSISVFHEEDYGVRSFVIR